MNRTVCVDRGGGLRRLSASQKRFFEANGYLVLEGFFGPSRIARLKARIDELWADRGPDCPLSIDCYEDYLGGKPMERSLFREVDQSARRFLYKLNDTHLVDEVIQDFALDVRL